MSLPPERSIINGRTYSEPYKPSSYNAGYGPYRSPRHSTDWILVGILIATLTILFFGA